MSDAAYKEEPLDQNDLEAIVELKGAYEKVAAEIGKVIVGQNDVIHQLMVSIFSKGHCILEGVPGLAKTLLISTIADTLHLSFNRIQFTPDLMPTDITGTEIVQEDKSTGERIFRFINGPVFANIILADEINRTPPKTQSALLEAMQEKQVTVGGKQYKLPDPFFVLATQNPIEQEGTYPLPEAQQDRFMFKIYVRYPSFEEEFDIAQSTTTNYVPEVSPVLSLEEIEKYQKLVRKIPVAPNVIKYALKIVRATRIEETEFDFIKEWLSWGAGPRAVQNLLLGAKTEAAIDGRNAATIDDIKKVVHPVLRHRIITNFNAESEGISTDDVIDKILQSVSEHSEDSLPQSAKNALV
ncbi:MAG: AAA family ATPase [Planctomycetota bacterium]|nr:MAG: AAA family ATPase [Planctomycetota bacterium]